MASWVRDEVETRWGAFPVDAVPRPIVLLDERVRIEGGFDDADTKEAWLGGRIGSSTPLPPGLCELLPARGRAHTDRELTITEVASTTAEFRCDRGPRDLPAYRLRVTGMYGSCVILSPEIECWWPRPALDRDDQPGGFAEIENDDITVHLSAFGGVLTEFHHAEFEEHHAFVVGRAITSKRSVPPGTRVLAKGIGRMVIGQLASPLNGRVLVNPKGQPMTVTPKEASAGQ
jgi:hypothetical protein